MTYQPPGIYVPPTNQPPPPNRPPVERPRRWGLAILLAALVLGGLLLWLAGDRVLDLYKKQLAPLQYGAAWVEFKAPDGSFAVSFPGKVIRVPVPKDGTKGFTMDLYQAIGLSHEASLAVTTYPQPIGKSRDAVYEAAISRLAKPGTDRKLIQARPITRDGREGRELKMESSQGPVTVHLFIEGDRLYNLVFVERKPDGAAAIRDRFLNSFRINR